MNHLDDRRRAMLARGLEAFDQAARRRRTRRMAASCAVALSAAIAAAALLDRAQRSGPAGLPESVELIVDDRDLAAELELSRACERIDRNEGRLVVVECVAPPPPDGGRSDGERRSESIG